MSRTKRVNVFEVRISYVDSPGVDSMYEHVSTMDLLVVARDVTHMQALVEAHQPNSAIESFERARYSAIVGVEEAMLDMAREVGPLVSGYCASLDHERCYRRKAVWDAVSNMGPVDCECECHQETT